MQGSGSREHTGDDPLAAYRAMLDDGDDQGASTLAARRLLHSIATPIFIKDKASRFVVCNTEFASYAGLTPADVIGLTDQDMPWGPVTGTAYVDWDEHVLTTGKPVTGIEEQILTADGSTRWLETDKVPLLDSNGNTIGLIGSFRDITDRLELRQSLLDMATAVATTENIDALLDEVVVGIQRMLDADMIAVLMADEHGAFELERHVTNPGFAVSAASATDVDFSWLGPLLKAGVKNGATVTTAEGNRLGPAQSALAAVMVVGDQPVGVLLLESSTLDLLTPSSAHRLGAIAGQASATISALDRSNDAGLTGASAERERLAQELHDSVLQTSWSVSLLAHAGLANLAPEDPTALILERIKVAASETQSATRSLVLDRSPSELARIPLRELVENAISAFSTQATVTVAARLEDVDANPEQRVAFYRIAQEALNNVKRHANATEVSVSLSASPGITLVIADDGVGFDPAESRPGHLGLGIMSSRAAKIAGNVTIASTPGTGTTVTARSVTARSGAGPQPQGLSQADGKPKRQRQPARAKPARHRAARLAWSLPLWCLASLLAVVGLAAVFTARSQAGERVEAAAELVDQTTVADERVRLVRSQLDVLILALAQPFGAEFEPDLAAAAAARTEAFETSRIRLNAVAAGDNAAVSEAQNLLAILDDAQSQVSEPHDPDELFRFADAFQFDGVPPPRRPATAFESATSSLWLDQSATFVVLESLTARFSLQLATGTPTPSTNRFFVDNFELVENEGGWLGPDRNRPLTDGYADVDVVAENDLDTLRANEDVLSPSVLWPEDQWIRSWASGPLGAPPTTASELLSDQRRTVAMMREISDERFELFITGAEAAQNDERRRVSLLTAALLGLAGIALGALGRTTQLLLWRVRELQTATRTDPLTGIGNRKLLESERARMARRPNERHHVVVSADMDRFKMVNDTYGHAFGDRVLRVVADGFHEIAEHGLTTDATAIRLGGDEFAIILHDDQQIDIARIRSELDALRTSLVSTTNGDMVPLDFSYGITSAYGDVVLDDLMHSSDLATYEDKARRATTTKLSPEMIHRN